jgi:hypothetical protein
LKVALLGDSLPPAGTEYVLAAIPADGDQIEARWYVCSATCDQRPLRVMLVGLEPAHYRTLLREGWTGLLSRVMTELNVVGAIVHDEKAHG